MSENLGVLAATVDTRRPGRRGFAVVLAASVAFALSANPATANSGPRAATKQERSTIKSSLRKHMAKDCGPGSCRVTGIRVSRINRRFAEVQTDYEPYNIGYFVKRASRTSAKWTVLVTFGGGIPGCNQFTGTVPNAVIREFRIRGARPGANTDVPCWTDVPVSKRSTQTDIDGDGRTDLVEFRGEQMENGTLTVRISPTRTLTRSVGLITNHDAGIVTTPKRKGHRGADIVVLTQHISTCNTYVTYGYRQGRLRWIRSQCTKKAPPEVDAAATSTTAPSASSARTCKRFIIGRANSSAYTDGKLPAHGNATGARCATLRRIARRLHNGTYKVPSGSGAPAPAWGSRFAVRDQGRMWSCRLQHRGGSGPYYAMRCSRQESRLSWVTGS